MFEATKHLRLISLSANIWTGLVPNTNYGLRKFSVFSMSLLISFFPFSLSHFPFFLRFSISCFLTFFTTPFFHLFFCHFFFHFCLSVFFIHFFVSNLLLFACLRVPCSFASCRILPPPPQPSWNLTEACNSLHFSWYHSRIHNVNNYCKSISKGESVRK